MYQQQQQEQPSFIDGFFASIPPYISWAFAAAGAVLGYFYGVEHNIPVPLTIPIGFLAGLIFLPLIATLLKLGLVSVIIAVVALVIIIAYQSQKSPRQLDQSSSILTNLKRATMQTENQIRAFFTKSQPEPTILPEAAQKPLPPPAQNQSQYVAPPPAQPPAPLPVGTPPGAPVAAQPPLPPSQPSARRSLTPEEQRMADKFTYPTGVPTAPRPPQ